MTVLLGIVAALGLLLLFFLCCMFMGRPEEHLQTTERLIDIQHQIGRMEKDMYKNFKEMNMKYLSKEDEAWVNVFLATQNAINLGIDLPDGYEFQDENGNIINATKIVLEKKKKEYPKTYEECCGILGLLDVDLCFNADYRSFDASKEQWKRLGLMNQFYQLLIFRDAYWKIAGEEMGLDGPWKPRWSDGHQKKYCIYNDSGDIKKGGWFFTNAILAFPTAEMRDAFYDFKELIEQCKELL